MARNHRYPHLLPDDVAIWEHFLTAHPKAFDTYDYDVRVGEGRPLPNLPTPQLRKMAVDLSQRRIDAIGHSANTRTVIEITVSAGLKALGQLEAYPILYRLTYPGDYNLEILLVAASIQSDTLPVLHAKGVPFWSPTDQSPQWA
jgi:hypothetical protein